MSLQFLGEMGVYFPDRDAISITALTPRAHIRCFATRSALTAIGCAPDDPPETLLDRFEANRLSIEIAAMIKYRRSTAPHIRMLTIDREDLGVLEPATKKGTISVRRPGEKHVGERRGAVRRRPAHLRRAAAAGADGEHHHRRP